jgi:TnpA family transposase
MSNLLSLEDIAFCNTKTGRANRLAFGVMLSYFRSYIKFPSPQENPLSVKLISEIREQLGLEDSSALDFDWGSRTGERYHQDIRKYLGFRKANDNDGTIFTEYLIKDILPHAPSNELLVEKVKIFFQQNKIELFKAKQLERYIVSAKYQFEQKLFKKIYKSLSAGSCDLIDQILKSHDQTLKKADEPKADITELAELKNDIAGAKLKNIDYALDKIKSLSKISIPDPIIDEVNRKLLLKYYDRVMALHPSNILEFAHEAKYAIMAIFCYIKLQIYLDDLADVFIKLVKRMRSQAEKYVDTYIVSEVKRVDGKFDILEKMASISVNHPKSTIEDKIYPEVPKTTLEELITDLQQRGKWYERQVQKKIRLKYIHGARSTILDMLKIFSLKEDHSKNQSILKAIEFIMRCCDEDTSEYYRASPPIEDIISASWHDMVVTMNGNSAPKINKYNYEIAVLEKLQSLLYFKAIWVEKSYRYRNPAKDTPKDFEQRRKYYYQQLELPLDAKEFISNFQSLLSENLEDLNAKIPSNPLVKIKASVTGNNITITPSDAQQEPVNITDLQKEIAQRWLSINLIDILKEADLLINFTKEMETIAKSSNISENVLRKRLLLCIYGIGSNTGLKRISIAGGVNYSDLRYVKKRHINATNVRHIIRLVINNILKIRDPDIWGIATTTVACDSTKVSSWDQNLMTEWHRRYKGKGVMIYWHVDKKSLCIYSQLKTCSSSEVGSMIKGVIDHDTAMNMNRVFVDTHGQSNIGFAISYLLGFDLLPRIKAINKQKLYSVSSKDKEKYTNISEIIKSSINWKLIEENYDEAVKHVVALKLGIVEPEVLVKRFSNNNYDHPVYRSLLEIGRANKSIFLCQYLKLEELRVEISEGLNIVERLNYIMDFIFYGKLGELATNNTDDQELSVLCLHLLQACIVYINTLIIQQVLSEEHWQNKLTPEDYRALTPLFSAHINPYGLFPIDFEQRILIYATKNQEQEY